MAARPPAAAPWPQPPASPWPLPHRGAEQDVALAARCLAAGSLRRIYGVSEGQRGVSFEARSRRYDCLAAIRPGRARGSRGTQPDTLRAGTGRAALGPLGFRPRLSIGPTVNYLLRPPRPAPHATTGSQCTAAATWLSFSFSRSGPTRAGLAASLRKPATCSQRPADSPLSAAISEGPREDRGIEGGRAGTLCTRGIRVEQPDQSACSRTSPVGRATP